MLRIAIAAVVLAAAGAVLFLRTHPVPEDARYIGSQRCGACHADLYREWADSQHNKMMQRVDAPDVVIADFDTNPNEVPLDRAEAVWAIGGKWEQQFMGHDGTTETLLPGAWLVAKQEWKPTGWDGWEVPVPVKRCHGCHTVGLDVAAGTFVEPNIGCESCHGPGSWHAYSSGLGAIHVSPDAQLCGQCHTRGTNPSGEAHFPLGYRPGRELAAHFKEEPPSTPNNSSHWWGHGAERGRHQQYFVWKQSGHAASLLALREGYDGRYGAVREECLGCHAGDYILAAGAKPPVEEAQLGITCSVCHQVHGSLDRPRVECSSCHPTGAFYHEPEENDAHVPCPKSARVDCVSCHMPLTIENGGAFTMHSHASGFITPAEAAAFDSPSGCQNGACHAAAERSVMQAAFEQHYEAPRVAHEKK